MIYIYGLHCPIEGVIRYIGKSINPKKRLCAHIGGALRGEYNHHTARWLRKLQADDLAPELVILRELTDGECWQDVERELIASADANGWRLTNSTAGGEGLDYIDPEAKAIYAAKVSASLKKVWGTPEAKKFASARAVSMWADPEITERRLASQKQAVRRPEVRARNLEVLAELASRPDIQAKKAASCVASWTGEAGKKRRQRASSEENRAKLSQAAIAKWADPEKSAALRAAASSPARRAKISESAIRRATPEYRAMMAEKTRQSWEKRRCQT